MKGRFARSARATLREFKERVQYGLDDIFARGSSAQFLLILAFALVVIAFGMSSYFLGLFDDENAEVEGVVRKIDGGFWDTLWWSMKHVFDPAFFDLDHGATLPVILVSLVVSIMGMVMFAILVGFMSSAIEERMATLRKGNSAVKESGHVLILGWSNKVPAILRLLARHRRGLKVVILAPRDVETMQQTLRVQGIARLPIKVILRSGCTSDSGELARVAFDKAFSIIVLAYDTSDHAGGDPNIEAIKTFLLLASYEGWAGARPKMVGEVSQNERREIALIAGRRSIPIVSSGQIVSKVLVQCARQGGLSSVYTEIFSSAGNSIYVLNFPGCAGRRFGEATFTFPDAVLVGVSRARVNDGRTTFVPVLSPGRDYVIQPGEWLIFLAACRAIAHNPALAPPVARSGTRRPLVCRPLERILIIGWNSSIYDIVAEFDEYVGANTPVDVVSAYEPAEAEARMADIGRTALRNVKVRYHRANSILRAALESLEISSFDCVVVLADESHEEADPDARTIMSLILLEDIRGNDPSGRQPRMLVEILDPRNRELILSANVSDVVVSPEVASMLLTQISQQQMLTAVYDHLFDSGGVEIYLKPADHYIEPGTTVDFNDVACAAQELGEIALGVSLSPRAERPDEAGRLLLNPSRQMTW